MKKYIIALISAVFGVIVGIVVNNKIKEKKIEEKVIKVDKFKSYYNLLNQWLILKQEGTSLEQYFLENNYKTIAIYGMGEMGSRLYDELKETSIVIKYAIDKNVGSTYTELNVVELEDELEFVDAVIITAIFDTENIRQKLCENNNFDIISLEDVVYGCS